MHATVFIKFGTMWYLYENETTKRRHVMPRSSAAVGCDVATFDIKKFVIVIDNPDYFNIMGYNRAE